MTPVAVASVKAATRVLLPFPSIPRGGGAVLPKSWWSLIPTVLFRHTLKMEIQQGDGNIVSGCFRFRRFFFCVWLDFFLALKLPITRRFLNKNNQNFWNSFIRICYIRIFWNWVRCIIGWYTASQTWNDELTTWNFPKNLKLKRSAVKSNSALFWRCALKLP